MSRNSIPEFLVTSILKFPIWFWCVSDRASLWQLKNKNQLDATYYFVVHYGYHTQRITTIEININRLSSTTERQTISHRTHTTKNHNFTLTLTPPSVQNETTNVVMNIIVVSSWWWA